MTPASSDRYQSRLFRFVYKQSRRFTQQCDRAWRNLQSTASWVAAVGLYPLYMLLQSRRSTANQVHQAVEKTLRQLPANDADTQAASPTVDTPIRQVIFDLMGVVESQKSKVKSQNSLTTHSISGIASELSSRSLVLVTAQNQTLDVLDPQQQQALEEEIIAAIAAYWQYRRNRNQSSLTTHHSPLTTPPWLTSLDHTVAEVESHHLVRVKSAAIAFYQHIFSPSTELADSQRHTTDMRTEASSKTRTTKILSLIWAAIDYFFGTDDRAVPPRSYLPSRNGVNSHFSGKPIPVKPRFAPNRPIARLPVSHASTDKDLEDPWLTASDLFGSIATETTGDRSISPVALPANPSAEGALPQRGGLRQFLSGIRAPQGMVRQQRTVNPPKPPSQGGQQSISQISKLQKSANERISPPFSRGVRGISVGAKGAASQKISPPFSRGVGNAKAKSLQKTATNNISTSANKTSSVQPSPDWIETPATLMGYVKHPLEQILAWLDRAMLWLEESLVKFWQWMQKMWRKF